MTFDTGASSELVGYRNDGGVVRVDTATSQWGVRQVRTIAVYQDIPVVIVVDRLPAPMVQTWHLDPAWTSTADGQWQTDDGETLFMATTGDRIERFAGEEGRGGFVYPTFGFAVPADQVAVTGTDVVATVWSIGDVAVDGLVVASDGSVSVDIDGTTVLVAQLPQ
ncbi:hypothetical protein BH24ACT5_BH24ACT5_02230 [soil metagenome]